jgi:hypothetical protein
VLENETDLIEETAAAMRELARTVTHAPPLRLAPRPDERALRQAPRRWRLWAAPLTAMAAVIVLAISLVTIRDISNGRVTPPTRPVPAADPGPTSASPGPTTMTASPAATPTTAPATTTAPASVPATSTAATPTGSITFVPMQTATGGEFFSPSGNINCEIDFRTGLVVTYCQTGNPARSVQMDASGAYTVCTGQQCLGNAGSGTPTLAYGTETGVGPFRCVSATTGVTCTSGGKGFVISTSGITPVPA